VVLLVAPVALSLADRLKISPVRLLLCIAVCTNLQGTATLIGDPPSMILAGYLKLNFNDFFVYGGRLGIFFAVQAGALAALVVVAWLLRAHREAAAAVAQEKVRAWAPTGLLLILVAGLSLTSVADPEFKWLAGTLTLVLAGSGLAWYRLGPHWTPVGDVIRTLDWDTTFFLMGVFVLVGGMTDSGWLDRLAAWLSGVVGQRLFAAYTVVVLASVFISAFVDNVPFLLAMIPVVQKMADSLGAPVPLLMYGLLIGACLGGNITPVGASANVVTVGLLKKRGYVVHFGEFMSVGVPFTMAAVVAASALVWWIWAP
ncbi:MAG: arsenic transporter, partial [Verrucomicrobia bacterium]|nr:arsenic transporter [Verrucomicrobiota bacterium]